MDEYRRTNLANWEGRVPLHAHPGGYDPDALADDRSALSGVVAFDAPRLGDLSGRRVLHLQCHIGTDTISLARLGGQVTGTDFSPAALRAARALAARAELDVRFVECELYDTRSALAGEEFDVVYTGVGALNWLPDITGWAQVVAALLRPGGRLHLREGHPMMNALEDERDDDLLVVGHPYFHTQTPQRWETTTSYTNRGLPLEHTVTYEWSHGLGEVVTAVLDAGLSVTGLLEHDEVEWQFLPCMERSPGGGRFALPRGRERLPLMYTLTARKPPA